VPLLLSTLEQLTAEKADGAGPEKPPYAEEGEHAGGP
jgi:hypothetical protein